jgi:hypothetical protein
VAVIGESVLIAMGIDHILLRIKREAGTLDAPAIPTTSTLWDER